MIRTITVGIDVGTSATRVVVIERGKESKEPLVIGTGYAETLGMRHGYITNPDLVRKAIRRAVRDAEKNSGVAIKKAIISIGGASLSSEISMGSIIISKSDGEVTNFDIENAMKEAEEHIALVNKRIVYRAPLSYKLDGKDVLGRPEGMRGSKLEVRVFFVTSLSQHLEDLEATLYEAGIEVLDIIPSPIAGAAVGLTSREKAVGAALINIGSETLSLAIYENLKLIGLHVFSIGSTDITNDIALGLRIPLEEAESIKIGTMISNHPKKKLDEIIEARLTDMFELIENYLRKIKRSELLPAGVIITGGGAGLPMVAETARAYLKLPSKIGTAEMLTLSKGTMRDSGWFVAYGLARMGEGNSGFLEGSSLGNFWNSVRDFLKGLGKQFMP